MTSTTERASAQNERQQLELFLARITRVHVRAAESPAPAYLPDGRRLRGIVVTVGPLAFVLARDLKWYALGPTEERATPVTLNDVLTQVTPLDLAKGLERAWTYAQQHHKVQRASRRPIWRR